MTIRQMEFNTGEETATIPTVSDPSADTDFVTKGYGDVNYMQGGRAVADVAALKAVAEADRHDNDIRLVDSLNALFKFDSASSTTGDDKTVIEPTVGTGRWIAATPNVLTAKGDTIGFTGTAYTRLAVGTDGQVLTADSGEASGLGWSSSLTNPMTTEGDIIIGGASGTPTRLPIGTDDYILRSNGTTLAWEQALATSSVAGLVTSVSGSAIPALAHGTWTPTVTLVSNMDSVTALSGIYQRVGNTVTGSMYGVLNSTAAGASQFRLTLPIASNFTNAANDAQGVIISYAASTDSAGGLVQADTANDQFIVTYYATNTGSYPSTFTFSYLVK